VQRAPYDYRADPAVSRFAADRPIVVFDSECVLCCAFAQFILRHDRNDRFRLLAAQSPTGAAPVLLRQKFRRAGGEGFSALQHYRKGEGSAVPQPLTHLTLLNFGAALSRKGRRQQDAASVLTTRSTQGSHLLTRQN
jgi:hypothetical protein